jgi:hypothetical protein
MQRVVQTVVELHHKRSSSVAAEVLHTKLMAVHSFAAFALNYQTGNGHCHTQYQIYKNN